MPNQCTFETGGVTVMSVRLEQQRVLRQAYVSNAGFKYFKSLYFPIHFMAIWWIFWLVMSYTDLMGFIPPSGQTLVLYALLVAFFLVGHYFVRILRVRGVPLQATYDRTPRPSISHRMLVTTRAAALLCTAMLLASLHLSGAFTTDFFVYFARLRMTEGDLGTLTGIQTLDVLTKILAFPLSYTVILVVLANGVQHFKFTLFLCILNLLAFAYLWQVNYSLVHLFWFLVFQLLVQANRRGSFDKRTLVIMLTLVCTLVAVAANRYGGDILGGLQRYIVGYHLIGFSFFDHHYQDPNSILHIHSFGRSSLGFLDQMLEALSKRLDLGYKAASFENSTYTNDAIDIGLREFKEFNAFGTLLFGLYRDFHIVGIIVGGFAYGALATHALNRSAKSWIWHGLFLILASTWVVGMMVNPVEQAYFWFAVVTLGMFNLVNRGVRF